MQLLRPPDRRRVSSRRASSVCPTEAILVGDLQRPDLQGRPDSCSATRCSCDGRRRRPRPKRVLHGRAPGHARPACGAPGPDGGLYTWSEQGAPDPQLVTVRAPGRAPRSSAAALLSYDVPHHAPWGWRVSLYTWTKGIAAGCLPRGACSGADRVCSTGRTRSLGAGRRRSIALVFLGITGVLLIWDLEHPAPLLSDLHQAHWRSWLVRGAFIIGGYGGCVVSTWSPLRLDPRAAQQVLGRRGHRRSGWRRRATPRTSSRRPRRGTSGRARCCLPHLAVQAVLAGAAALLPFARGSSPARGVRALEWCSRSPRRSHLLARAGPRLSLPHVTAHARLAAHEMTRGRFARVLLGRASSHVVGRRRRAVDRRRRRAVRARRAAGARARLRPGRPIGAAGLRRSAWRRRLIARAERVCGRRAQDVEARGETFYPGPSGMHLAAFPPKERWDDWVELDSGPGRGESSTTTCWCPRPASTASRPAGSSPTSTRRRCTSASSRATRASRARAAATAPRAGHAQPGRRSRADPLPAAARRRRAARASGSG